jgi:hypothetical protein
MAANIPLFDAIPTLNNAARNLAQRSAQNITPTIIEAAPSVRGLAVSPAAIVPRIMNEPSQRAGGDADE